MWVSGAPVTERHLCLNMTPTVRALLSRSLRLEDPIGHDRSGTDLDIDIHGGEPVLPVLDEREFAA